MAAQRRGSEPLLCGSAREAYVRALHARRSTPDGLFAAKLHWGQLVRIRAGAAAGPGDRPSRDGELAARLAVSRQDPLVVSYEELTSQFEATVRRVAARIQPGLAIDVAAPQTRRLRDERSLELLERFREQRR